MLTLDCRDERVAITRRHECVNHYPRDCVAVGVDRFVLAGLAEQDLTTKPKHNAPDSAEFTAPIALFHLQVASAYDPVKLLSQRH